MLIGVYPSAIAGQRISVIDVECDTLVRKCCEKSSMDRVLMRGLKSEPDRYFREFLSKAPNASGYYYPKYEANSRLEHGSPHISYLARPYFNYSTSGGSKTFGASTKKQCV